jgi:dCMP deaminase
MIIGVTGGYCSGKDTVASFLQKMNFEHFSLSDFIREEAKKRDLKLTRDNLIMIGNDLREKYGANVLAKKALEKVLDGENYVITSIRNPEEARYLMQRKEFLLVNVITPEKIRLQRIIARNREEDPKTLQQLREKERKENSKDANSQQLNEVAKMAKVTVVNEASLEALQQKVEQLVKDWMYKLQPERPDWDHYFMNIAEAVKLRANCMSAKKGAILVKDKQIISTGYNGSPKNIKHCNEGGCIRCTARHLGELKSGNYSKPCICAHSEENAIVQAAWNGVSTRGATLYTTFTPCTACCKMIINAGIVEVVAKVRYPDDVGTQLLKEAGVKLRVLE